MCCAEPDDPQDAEVAKQYKLDMELFNSTAKYWTRQFASEGEGDGEPMEEIEPPKAPEEVKLTGPELKVAKLWEMGFDEASVKDALERYDYNEELATNYLLGG